MSANCCPIYDVNTGEFLGIEKRLAAIAIRGDPDKCFLSYGYDPQKTKILFSNFKRNIPNIFQSTAFKKYHQLLKSNNKGDFSMPFFYLPSTTDRKEKINQYKSHAQLSPVTALYQDFTKFGKDEKPFPPQHLESHNIA